MAHNYFEKINFDNFVKCFLFHWKLHWRRYVVFVVNFEQMLLKVLVFPLLTLIAVWEVNVDWNWINWDKKIIPCGFYSFVPTSHPSCLLHSWFDSTNVIRDLSCTTQIRNTHWDIRTYLKYMFWISYAAWKVSKYGIFSGPYLETFLAVLSSIKCLW